MNVLVKYGCLSAITGACSFCLNAQESNGLAPEVTDLNAKDISYALEKKIPYLEKPYIGTSPKDMNDGIPVGELGVDGGNKKMVLQFAEELADGKYNNIDSMLIFYKGKLLFESYYRRGRVNYPHYQMSITKSYTAMALGRAVQLGYISMADMDKPVVDFLKKIDQTKLVAGAKDVTLSEAMNMHSGIRISQQKARELMKNRDQLKGQGQIQAYLQYCEPITEKTRKFKYQGSDPSITMQVIEVVVPGTAKDFIKKELLGKMGISNYAWQNDVSGLPKSAAGCSLRSRDMLKFGMLVQDGGKWNGEQLIPEKFVSRATGKLYTNSAGTSYGYFWWRHDMKVGEKNYDCKSGRGAGGQFIMMFPELELICVFTSHIKGMGGMLAAVPKKLLPAFINN